MKLAAWGRDFLIGLGVTLLFWFVTTAINPPVRQFLLKKLPVPFWADHILFMVTTSLLVAVLIGAMLLGLRNTKVCLPRNHRYVWKTAIATGLGLTLLLIAVVVGFGYGKLGFQLNLPLMFGNLFSNFYEEYIFRGVLLSVLQRYWRNRWLALSVSTLLFAQGHFHYPLPLIALTVFVGLVWGWMAIRFESIWPSWLSHCLVDFIGDTVLR